MRLFALSLALLATTGCMKSYTVHKTGDYVDAENAHYVIVRTKPNGKMHVYDCIAFPDGQDYDPTCTRVEVEN